MIKKLLYKISFQLYKTHLFINKRLKAKSPYKPSFLHYQPVTTNPKIIHVNANFIVGGTTQLIIDIVERTSDKYTHEIIVPHYPEPLPYQPVAIKKFPIEEMMKLYNYLKEVAPKLVHIHYWVRDKHRYDAYALWYQAVFKICEELGIGVIQNVNVPTAPYLSAAVLHNVFVSKYVLDNFNKSSAHASVIYPGSNFKHFDNTDIDALPNAIGMVYRLDQDKLDAASIEVFISVAKEKSAIKCYIIGDGYFFKYYKQRVEEENLESSFIFTGVVSYNELPAYYKQIGIFVAPVHDESFGQVTPFAMSMGLAVAGYDIGALSEILGYKETLVDYGNIEMLTATIINLIDHPQKRKTLGKLNQQRAHENFSVERMIEEYRKLYKQYVA